MSDDRRQTECNPTGTPPLEAGGAPQRPATNRWLRAAFFLLVVKPLTAVVLGMHVRDARRLPRRGPALLVANHNSHLDTVVLIALFPLSLLSLVRPVAAADYFLRNRWLAWFALRIVGIIPLDRTGRRAGTHPLAPCIDALDRGEILILFPEDTRGEPEARTAFRSGVAHLVRCRPDVPVVPVYMHGLGKALPRGEALLVPMICDISVGEPLPWNGDKAAYMRQLEDRFNTLSDAMRPLPDDEATDGEGCDDDTTQ